MGKENLLIIAHEVLQLFSYHHTCNGLGIFTSYQPRQRLPSHYTSLLLINPKATNYRHIVLLPQMTHLLTVQKVKCVFIQVRQDSLLD